MEIRPLRSYAAVALGRQRSPQHESGSNIVRYLRAANVKDGALDLSDVLEMNFSPAEQTVFSLRPHDVLVTEGSGSLRAVGASAIWGGELEGPVCFQNTLLRLRPRPGTDHRFLAWWCRYAFADGVFASIANGANIFHVSAERVRSLPVTYLPLGRQKAIADFLDAETARLDTLITKKRQLADLAALGLRERAHSLTHSGIRAPLRRMVSSIRTGATPPADALEALLGGDVPWLSPGDVDERMILRSPARSLDRRALSQRMCPLFPPDSTLIVSIGNVGRVLTCLGKLREINR